MAHVLRTPIRTREETTRKGETPPRLMKLKKLFRYEPSTGQLIRLTNQSPNARRGDIVGSPHNAGYLQLQANGKKYLAHRVAWFLMTGQDIEGVEIDHRNGNRADNRWSNLRLATRSQQRGNRIIKGYSFRNRHGKDEYVVHFRKKHVGVFKTAEDAQNAYRQKAEEFWGDYAGHRR